VVPIVALWLPVLVSAVLVFVVSSLVHMVLPLHKNDFRKVPSEDAVMDALRPLQIPPGDYMFPRPSSTAEMRTPEFKAKHARGPVALMTVFKSGQMGMGESLGQWFVYLLVAGIFTAYVAGRALAPGAEYLKVFRFAGVTAYLAYGLALVQESIWYKRNWGTTLVYQFDALLYALVTAGVFGCFWPK